VQFINHEAWPNTCFRKSSHFLANREKNALLEGSENFSMMQFG
jgi:hypothetical protein